MRIIIKIIKKIIKKKIMKNQKELPIKEEEIKSYISIVINLIKKLVEFIKGIKTIKKEKDKKQ